MEFQVKSLVLANSNLLTSFNMKFVNTCSRTQLSNSLLRNAAKPRFIPGQRWLRVRPEA